MSRLRRRLGALTRTTAFQLTLSYSLLFAISLSLVTLFFYFSTVSVVVRETDAALKSEITGLAEQYIEHGLDRLVNVIAHRIRNDDTGDMLYLFATRDDQPLVGNLRVWPDVEPDGDGWIEFAYAGEDGAVSSARGRVYLLRDGLQILVARNVRRIAELEQVVNRGMMIALGLTVVLAIIGGGLMSSRVLQRISTFTDTTAEIIDGRLDRRLETRGSGDEFDVLAEQLNQMLDRLESLVAAVRHVSDNIAHDLRTPLTRLRNRIELASRDAPDSLKEELEAGVAEADALLATFASLLRIARIESGSYSAKLEPQDVSTLVEDAVELYQGVAQEKDVVIVADSDPDVVLECDRNLLFQALANLLDNAIKFAPAGSAVAVDARAIDQRLDLVVADAGPGIPAAEHRRVTQRFARLDGSRSLPGSGLGLSLVKAVAELHHGRLSFEDNVPGL
ncbi:MAG: ATP-binding protein, partial [Gammaproteobacteria bacterium]